MRLQGEHSNESNVADARDISVIGKTRRAESHRTRTSSSGGAARKTRRPLLSTTRVKRRTQVKKLGGFQETRQVCDRGRGSGQADHLSDNFGGRSIPIVRRPCGAKWRVQRGRPIPFLWGGRNVPSLEKLSKEDVAQ